MNLSSKTLSAFLGASLRFSSLSLVAAVLSSTLNAAELTGAGASLPAPVYVSWSDAYFKATGNRINYQSIGSGGGVKEVIGKSIDFGATDIPLSAADLEKHGLVQFPTVVGGVVLIANLPGVQPGEVKLSGPVLADIFMGKIAHWRHPDIARLNSGVKLPDMAIAVVRRSDGAGSTLTLSNYLSKVSPAWKQKLGEGTVVQWPRGLGGKGDEGVDGFVQRLPGSIGYVDFAYAHQHKLATIQMQNSSGEFVAANEQSIGAAAAAADWEKYAFGPYLTDLSAKGVWPLASTTFILMRKLQDKPAIGTEALKYFDWAYKRGAKSVADNGYVPVPDGTVSLILGAAWPQLKDPAGKPVFAQQ